MKAVWTEKCGNQESRYPGEAALVAQGKTWENFCVPAPTLSHGAHTGKNGSFLAIRMKMHKKFLLP